MKKKLKILNRQSVIDLPETCPFCQKEIVPDLISSFKADIGPGQGIRSVYLALQCPSCKNVFFARYLCNRMEMPFPSHDDDMPSNTGYYLMETIGGSGVKQKFSKEIESLSPRFVSIFRQADAARQEGRKDVAGIGFRYSFEILIKDYLISLDPDKKDTISKTPLGDCVSKLDPDIFDKELFKDTVWLGNDFAHYVSKHPEMDIHELRDAIMSCVEKIDRHIKDQNLKKKLCPDKQS